MIQQGEQIARQIYLDVPHSANPKPSWYGELVGHYEGDTLVVDTIGLNSKTFVDHYRTPHTEKLHVVERWRMIEAGKKLEVSIHDRGSGHVQSAVEGDGCVIDRAKETLSENICVRGQSACCSTGLAGGKNAGLLRASRSTRRRSFQTKGLSSLSRRNLLATAAADWCWRRICGARRDRPHRHCESSALRQRHGSRRDSFARHRQRQRPVRPYPGSRLRDARAARPCCCCTASRSLPTAGAR